VGQRYHVRSPEHVVGELAMLVERYRPDHIWFMDDIMASSRAGSRASPSSSSRQGSGSASSA